MRLEDVGQPVQIVVAYGDAHASLLCAVFVQRDPAFQTDLAERAIVVVPKQQAGRGIAGDVNIGPAVVVEIRRHGSQAVRACHPADPRPLRDLLKCPVASIVK